MTESAKPRQPLERRVGNDARGRRNRAMVVRSVSGVLRLTGAQVRILGEIPEPGCVIAFHHNAPVDALILGLAGWRKGHHPIAMVHGGVFRAPVIGRIVTSAGMVPVERVDRGDRDAAYNHALAHLAAGHTMFVAPEGGISKSFTVHPLRHGAVRMAMEAGVPLVPTVSFGSQRFGGSHGQPLRPRRNIAVDLSFGKPLEITDAEDTTKRLHTVLTSMLDDVIANYPDPGVGQWWWPAHLGGTAPTVEEAAARRRERFGAEAGEGAAAEADAGNEGVA